MYRSARKVKGVVVVVMAVMTMLFIPPLRNVLTLGMLPELWKDVPTFQLMKVQWYSSSSSTAALSSCVLPARAVRSTADSAENPNSPESKAKAKAKARPKPKPKPRPRDVAQNERALSWLNHSSQRQERYGKFRPRMSAQDKADLLETWRVLHETLKRHNVSHFATDGTVLGALRHGGLIPWDDDLDVGVDGADLQKAVRALSCVPGYTLRLQPSLHWKFFAQDAQVVAAAADARVREPPVLPLMSSGSRRKRKEREEEVKEKDENKTKKNYSEKKKENEKKKEEDEEGEEVEDLLAVQQFHVHSDVVMRFPFIDVFVFRNDGAYLWPEANFLMVTNLYSVDDLYPLIRLPFEGLPEGIPAPRRIKELIHKIFSNPNSCVSAGHDHKQGRAITHRSVVPCKELADMYTVNVL